MARVGADASSAPSDASGGVKRPHSSAANVARKPHCALLRATPDEGVRGYMRYTYFLRLFSLQTI